MATEFFTVITDEETTFHNVVDTRTGEIVGAYPLKKTANRAARQRNEREAYDAAQDAKVEAKAEEAEKRFTFTDGTSVTEAEWEADRAQAVAQWRKDMAEAAARQKAGETFPHSDHMKAMDVIVREALDALDAERNAASRAEFQAKCDAAKAEAEIAGLQWDHNVAMHVMAEEVNPEAAASVQIGTREEWLRAAAELIRPILADKAGLTLPPYRVSCSWPSKGGTGDSKGRVLGQCWAACASADGHAEIFITPMEDDRRFVLGILTHELIHACLPQGTGHRGPFAKAALSLGFGAPVAKWNPTEDLWVWIDQIIAALPAYPHAKLDPGARAEGAPKKQKNRMTKAVCTVDGCGYLVRVARKWVEEVGAPICPRHKAPMYCEGVDVGGVDDGEGNEGEEG